MPHLRLTADRRGYENTFLLHSTAPGERPKVIYWYRTAPGVRLGRPALDDGAMRSLEEQYPDIDFDWPYLLDIASMTPVEVEGPVPVRKRKPQPRREDDDEGAAEAAPRQPAAAAAVTASPSVETGEPPVTPIVPPPGARPAAPWHQAEMLASAAADLLSELLGRGIASSLRAAYHDLAARVEGSPASPDLKAAWRVRLAALDPDAWTAPGDVLAGMATVERDTDDLHHAIDAAEAGA